MGVEYILQPLPRLLALQLQTIDIVMVGITTTIGIIWLYCLITWQ